MYLLLISKPFSKKYAGKQQKLHRWIVLVKGNFALKIAIKITPNRGSLRKISRELIAFIDCLRSDHYNLSGSLARIYIMTDPTCDCKRSVQDIDHVVWDCPLLDHRTQDLIKNSSKTKNPNTY